MQTLSRPAAKIVASLTKAGAYTSSPTYSLFAVSAMGEYSLLLQTTDVTEAATHFEQVSLEPDTVGLELRCNGSRVTLDI